MRSPFPKAEHCSTKPVWQSQAVGACCLLAGSVQLSGRTQGQVGRCTRWDTDYCLASDSLASGTKALLRCDFYKHSFSGSKGDMPNSCIMSKQRLPEHFEVFHSEKNGSYQNRKLLRVHADSCYVTYSKCDMWFS